MQKQKSCKQQLLKTRSSWQTDEEVHCFAPAQSGYATGSQNILPSAQGPVSVLDTVNVELSPVDQDSSEGADKGALVGVGHGVLGGVGQGVVGSIEVHVTMPNLFVQTISFQRSFSFLSTANKFRSVSGSACPDDTTPRTPRVSPASSNPSAFTMHMKMETKMKAQVEIFMVMFSSFRFIHTVV